MGRKGGGSIKASVFHDHRVFILGSIIGASIGLTPFIIFTAYYIGPMLPQYKCATQERYSRDTVQELDSIQTFTIPEERPLPVMMMPPIPTPVRELIANEESRQSSKSSPYGNSAGPPSERERMNLISQRLIYNGQPEIDGWWMSHSKWNVSLQCNDPSHPYECSQIFTTDCRKQMTTAIYQFLPVKHRSHIVGVDFTAKGAAFSSFHWNDDSKKMDAAVVSSQALLKYTDESYEIVRLHYPTGNYSVMSVGMSKMFPPQKKLKSITAMLTCYGFDGSALFRDTTIKPIFAPQTSLEVQKDRRKCISKCPHYYKPDNQDNLPFDLDKQVAVTKFQVKHSNLTMVTHLSIDRIDILQKSIAVWTGLMSISVFVPVMDSKKANHTEPVLTSTKVTDMPLFDVRFSGYGFNKIQHTMELMYNDYSLEVLPNVWAVHVYHRISPFKKQFLNGLLTRLENRIKRYEYVSEIMRKYHIGRCSDAKS